MAPNQGEIGPPGDIWQILDTFKVVNSGEGTAGIWQAEARDAAKHVVRHPAAPHKTYLAQNVDRAQFKKPCLKPCLLSLFKKKEDSSQSLNPMLKGRYLSIYKELGTDPTGVNAINIFSYLDFVKSNEGLPGWLDQWSV